jgi:hypothetical protein
MYQNKLIFLLLLFNTTNIILANQENEMEICAETLFGHCPSGFKKCTLSKSCMKEHLTFWDCFKSIFVKTPDCTPTKYTNVTDVFRNMGKLGKIK